METILGMVSVILVQLRIGTFFWQEDMFCKLLYNEMGLTKVQEVNHMYLHIC